MKNIDEVNKDPRFDEFCQLAEYFLVEYGIYVWHSNAVFCEDFYESLGKMGYDVPNQIYSFGGGSALEKLGR